MNDQTRNLNPHKFAVAAMWLFGAEYSKQGGGSMDFWDRLPGNKKDTIFMMIMQIEQAQSSSEEIQAFHIRASKARIGKK
jgi:hypothetical protein